jgi:hypothetical protein
MKATAASAPRLLAALALFGALTLPGPASQAGAQEKGPVYSLAADAAAGLLLAGQDLDFAAADSAALFSVSANFLHRIEAPGWGMVLSHSLDISSASADLIAGAAPTLCVYEAYARLDLGDWAQVFLGKRRMGLGLGTTFAPGDAIDPRTGFWDQKNGFRGLDASFSLGSDIALRFAASFDRSFDAYAAGLAAKAAAAQGGPTSQPALDAKKGYAAALGDAAGPADPRLIVWALSTDAQLGSLQASLAAVYSPDYLARPSLGLSLDLGGLILQAEGAVELVDGPSWFGTAGARETWTSGDANLSLSLDYDYNGAPGLLKNSHYLLPSLRCGLVEKVDLYVRALVELGGPSALLSTGLTFYPVPGFDIETTGSFALGGALSELVGLAALAAPPSPLAPPSQIRDAIGLAARVHF